MNPGEYDVMADVEDHHWWYRGLRDAIRKVLLSGRVSLRSAPRILDAGCGTGANLALCRRAFAPSYLAGFDMSERALELAQRRASPDELYQSDLCDPELRQGDFDLILSMDVLCIPGPERARPGLRKLVDHLAPGGLFVVNVPAYEWLQGEHDVAVHTTHRFTVPELRALFTELGLEPVLSTYRLCFLLPAMVASRLRHRPRAESEARSDLQRAPGRLVNGVLERVLYFENDLIASGASLPFGGSVFVIGRKPTRSRVAERSAA